jgi:hypothetical protein
MCRIITPDNGEGHVHAHVDAPIGIAELVRDSLVQELTSMGDLMAHWHMIEDAEVKHALIHALESKRVVIGNLYRTMREAEERALNDGGEHGHSHGHAHE